MSQARELTTPNAFKHFLEDTTILKLTSGLLTEYKRNGGPGILKGKSILIIEVEKFAEKYYQLKEIAKKRAISPEEIKQSLAQFADLLKCLQKNRNFDNKLKKQVNELITYFKFLLRSNLYLHSQTPLTPAKKAITFGKGSTAAKCSYQIWRNVFSFLNTQELFDIQTLCHEARSFAQHWIKLRALEFSFQNFQTHQLQFPAHQIFPTRPKLDVPLITNQGIIGILNHDTGDFDEKRFCGFMFDGTLWAHSSPLYLPTYSSLCQLDEMRVVVTSNRGLSAYYGWNFADNITYRPTHTQHLDLTHVEQISTAPNGNLILKSRTKKAIIQENKDAKKYTVSFFLDRIGKSPANELNFESGIFTILSDSTIVIYDENYLKFLNEKLQQKYPYIAVPTDIRFMYTLPENKFLLLRDVGLEIWGYSDKNKTRFSLQANMDFADNKTIFSPSLSPDHRYVAFVKGSRLQSIDLISLEYVSDQIVNDSFSTTGWTPEQELICIEQHGRFFRSEPIREAKKMEHRATVTKAITFSS